MGIPYRLPGFFLALIVLGYLAWRLFGQPSKTDLIAGFFGGILGALITLLLAYVAWKQLSDISKTASGYFILRLKSDFFKEETRRLVQLIDNDWLKFVQEDEEGNEIKNPFFKVDEGSVSKKSGLHPEIQKRLLERKAYSVYDIDDFLGHFEDMATLWKSGVLDIDMVYDMFSWYVEAVWKNCEIQKYIETQKEDSKDIYEGFECLYEECRRIEKSKR